MMVNSAAFKQRMTERMADDALALGYPQAAKHLMRVVGSASMEDLADRSR